MTTQVAADRRHRAASDVAAAAAVAASAAAAASAELAARAAERLGVATTLRLDRVEEALSKVSDSLLVLVRLEERMSLSVEEDTRFRAGADDRERRLQLVEKSIGPLIEARKWVIAAGLGIISLVAVSVFNAFINYQGKVEQAAQASRVERVLAAPQAERPALVSQPDKASKP